MANELILRNKIIFSGGQPLTLPVASSDPGSAVAGDLYFNSTSGKMRMYDGSAWANLTTGSISLTGQTLNAGNVIIGNGSNASAAFDTASAGDIAASTSTGLTIKSGVITNSQINASAAIAYSKLALSGSIVNADVSATAAIAYSKLNLATSIVNGDISTSAAIAYSKLSLTSSIVNADIASGAAIAYSKLNLATSIVNGDISASAAIAYSKLAALTASKVLVSDGSGFVSASSVSTTTLGYLDATSSIQTQLNGKATTALDNLASTAVNADIVPDAYFTRALGTPGKAWQAIYTVLIAGNTSTKFANASTHVIYDTSDLASAKFADRQLVSDTVVKLDWSGTDVSLNTRKLTDVVDPTSPQDAATKYYVDNHSGTAITALTGDVLATGPGSVTATIASGAITNGKVSATAAIAYSKLNLATSIVNGDISSSAAIAYSKLNLASSIVNADISSSAAIAYSKLSLSSSIVNSDIASGAAIDYSKLSLATSIVNGDISASAAIAYSKLAALTASKILVSDGSGVVSASSVSTTTLGYLDATSSIQTQLNGKLNLSGGTMSGNITMGGYQIKGMANPSSSDDAATKGYVDSVAEGLRPKESVRVATTANITLSGHPTIDGVTVADADRVLVKDQTAAAENGIYIVSSGGWDRSTDMDSLFPIDEVKGSYVPVREGTANAGKIFVCTSDPAVLNTDPINFIFYNSSSGLVGGDGITISGSNVSVNHDGQGLQFSGSQLSIELDTGGGFPTLAKSGSGLKVATGGIKNNEIASGAAIDYSKLALSGSIVDSDISSGASISYSKLNLTGDIVDADISSIAQIARNKINSGSQGYVVYNDDSSGLLAEEARLSPLRGGLGTDASNFTGVLKASSGVFSASAIVNADVASGAAIDFSKLHSSAINVGLVPDTDVGYALGSLTYQWSSVSSPILNSSGDITINANSGASNVQVQATVVKTGSDGSHWLEEQYIDAVTLTANTTVTVTSYAGASYSGAHVEYVIKQASTNATRTGKLYLANNGTSATSLTDQSADTADCEITLTADVSGANVRIRAQNLNATNDSTIRLMIKRFRA